jgi:hypothetical protein
LFALRAIMKATRPKLAAIACLCCMGGFFHGFHHRASDFCYRSILTTELPLNLKNIGWLAVS